MVILKKPFLPLYRDGWDGFFPTCIGIREKWNTRMRVQLITGVVVENMDFRLCTT